MVTRRSTLALTASCSLLCFPSHDNSGPSQLNVPSSLPQHLTHCRPKLALATFTVSAESNNDRVAALPIISTKSTIDPTLAQTIPPPLDPLLRDARTVANIDTVQIDLVGRNLFTMSDYTGLNPAASNGATRVDAIAYPNTRTFTLQLSTAGANSGAPRCTPVAFQWAWAAHRRGMRDTGRAHRSAAASRRDRRPGAPERRFWPIDI